MPHAPGAQEEPFTQGDAYRRGRANPYPFTNTPQWLLISGISPTAYFVYDVLNAHVNQLRKETTGDTAVWPGQATLAALAGMKRDRSIRRYLAELQQLGAIDIYRERDPHDPMRRRNVYIVHETPPEGYSREVSLPALYRELKERVRRRPQLTLAQAYLEYDVEHATNNANTQVTGPGPEGRSRVPPEGRVHVPGEGRTDDPRQGRTGDPEQDEPQPHEGELDGDAASRRSRAYGRRPSTGSRGNPVENSGGSAAAKRAQRAETARARKILDKALPKEFAPQFWGQVDRMPGSIRAVILNELEHRSGDELIERVHRRWDLWFYAKGNIEIDNPVACLRKMLTNNCPDVACEDGILLGPTGQNKHCPRCEERREDHRRRGR